VYIFCVLFSSSFGVSRNCRSLFAKNNQSVLLFYSRCRKTVTQSVAQRSADFSFRSRIQEESARGFFQLAAARSRAPIFRWHRASPFSPLLVTSSRRNRKVRSHPTRGQIAQFPLRRCATRTMNVTAFTIDAHTLARCARRVFISFFGILLFRALSHRVNRIQSN